MEDQKDNNIFNYSQIKKNINSGQENAVCKIKINETFKGTGFFCNIRSINMKALITNNHVLNENDLNNNKIICGYEINDEKEISLEINLEINRYKLTDKDYDFTIIEILNEDNINYFLEIDDNINNICYKINEQIFCFEYPGGKKLQFSNGNIIGKRNDLFLYDLGTGHGSSGSPILLVNNSKIIGLHKGKITKWFSKRRRNIGIPLHLIFKKLNNFIKCVYDISLKNIGEEIQIINDGYYDYHKKQNFKNNEVAKKVKIMIDGKIRPLVFKYKFNRKGKYNIYFFIGKELLDMSYMFYECIYLNEINLSPININNVESFSKMFYNCSSLKKIDLPSFKTNKPINLSYMFYYCSTLREINLSLFNISNVIDISHMFYFCSSLQ